jgi:uncharacterized protein (TIGR04255 family)
MEFENPPVVELIAELRWLPAGVRMAADNPANVEIPPAFFAAGQPDALFMTFGGRVGQDGYTQIERLMPAGMPPIPFQPIFRYSRPHAPDVGTYLYQLGPGIFSAHATPPYKSWAAFRPDLARGTANLLAARTAEENAQPFMTVAVRYIDGFTADYLGDLSIPKFLSEILGFDIAIPAAVADLVEAGKEISPQVRLNLPVKGGFQMTLALADGHVRSTPALIMDTSVSTATAVASAVDEVMRAFDAAHRLVSDVFVNLTASIHDRMKPRQ